jgi:hypothetical protein
MVSHVPLCDVESIEGKRLLAGRVVVITSMERRSSSKPEGAPRSRA